MCDIRDIGYEIGYTCDMLYYDTSKKERKKDVSNLDFFVNLSTRMECFYVDCFYIGESEKIQWSPEFSPDIDELKTAIELFI